MAVEFQAIRGQTTPEKEFAAFTLMRDLCLGQDVKENHPLKAQKTSASILLGYLVSRYGFWQPTIEQVYTSFKGKGARGARMGIMVLCASDEGLRTLFQRYDPDDTLRLFQRL
jgi:hypothetical protein